MAGGSPIPNPFLQPPRKDPLRDFQPLTVRERMQLAKAPRKPGTQVTVRAYPAPFRFSPKDHMYVEYDDGSEQYIFRGGPSWHGVHAEVAPAQESPDYGRGGRIVHRTDLPGVSAREAIRPVQATVARVEDSGAPYGLFWSNSNGVVADGTEAQLGYRVGDSDTPGWQTPIPYLPQAVRRRALPRREP